jgi:enediyne biosynthesis protein E4
VSVLLWVDAPPTPPFPRNTPNPTSEEPPQPRTTPGAVAAPFGGPPGAVPPQFVDVAASAGIDFTFFRGETVDCWVPEVTGGGVAWIDYDGDNSLDLYLINGCELPADPRDFRRTARLFRGGSRGTFSNSTDPTGVGHNGYGQGCEVGDYDNDGFPDLYLASFGPNVLYHNNGDGTFSAQTRAAGAECDGWSVGAVFADLDLDGDLDLLICNYLNFDPASAPTCTHPTTQARMHCGPRFFDPLQSILLHNRGDGTFLDISHAPGIDLPLGKSMAIVVADLDNDGRPDVYVTNDGEPNFLLLNHALDGADSSDIASSVGFSLTNAALEAAAGVNAEGVSQGSMGIACGDYDRDGDLDLAVTNFHLEYLTLYRNLRRTGFADVSRTCGLATATHAYTGWGTGFVDYDNDGWLDLFVANGHTSPDTTGAPMAMPAQLFCNMRNGRFQEVSATAGPYFFDRWIGRGCAFGDFDRDGRTDIVVVHHDRPAALLQNRTESKNHYLQIDLVGRASNRSALHTRVRASLPGSADAAPIILHEIIAGGSYGSAHDRRVTLGLGSSMTVDTLEVHWPSGLVERWENVAADQVLRVTEGLGWVGLSVAPKREATEPGLFTDAH